MFYLTFLGTSSGVPTKYRNVSALAVACVDPYTGNGKANNHRPWILVDCGEGTQQQILHTKLSLLDLHTILITHVHGDHCYGLAGLLASMGMSGRTEPLRLIAPQAIQTLLDALTQATELFLPFSIEFIGIETLLTNPATEPHYRLTFSEQHHIDINITPLSHRVPSYAFALTQHTIQHKLDRVKLEQAGIARGALWGQLCKGQDVTTDTGLLLCAQDYVKRKEHRLRIVIAGDNDRPALLSPLLQDTTLLVHEATYTEDVLSRIQDRVRLGQQLDPQHSTAGQIAQFAQAAAIPNLILTHFSARYQLTGEIHDSHANMAHVRAEATNFYQGNLWLAEDFAHFAVNANTLQRLD